jgi:hypothetical protein
MSNGLKTPCSPAGDFPCEGGSDGVCVYCDHVLCAACGAPIPREEARPLHWVPGGVAPGVLCPTCLAADGEADTVTCNHCGKLNRVTVSPTYEGFSATCACYDGAPDSHCALGHGATPKAAKADWEEANALIG